MKGLGFTLSPSMVWRHGKEFSSLVNTIVENDAIFQGQNIPKEKHTPQVTSASCCLLAVLASRSPCLRPLPPLTSTRVLTAQDGQKSGKDGRLHSLLLLSALCCGLDVVPGPGIPSAHRQAIRWRTRRRVQEGHQGPVRDRNVSGFQSKELPCSRQRSQFQMFQGVCIWPQVSVFWEHAGSGQDKGERKPGPSPWHSPEENRPANSQIRRAQIS